MCIVYFYLDMAVDSLATGGVLIHVMMVVKFIIFFFFLFVEFFARRNPFKLLATAVVVSMAAYLLSLGSYWGIFSAAPENSFRKRESGLQLLRMGFTSPLPELKSDVMRNSDRIFFARFFPMRGSTGWTWISPTRNGKICCSPVRSKWPTSSPSIS
jgi:hypothetical protein